MKHTFLVVMKYLKNTVGIGLALYSAYMLVNGAWLFVNTSGVVQGSDFGMLVTLVNQLGQLMIWLALFALWSVIPIKSQAQPA